MTKKRTNKVTIIEKPVSKLEAFIFELGWELMKIRKGWYYLEILVIFEII